MCYPSPNCLDFMSGQEFEKSPELSTRELVEVYVNIPLGNPVNWPDLPQNLEKKLRLLSESDEQAIALVENGFMEPEEAEQEIIERYVPFLEDNPEHEGYVKYTQRFSQAKAWMAYLINTHIPELEIFRKDSEYTARLLLQAEVDFQSRISYVAVYIFKLLINAGKHEEAGFLARETFADVIWAKDQAEVERLARQFGERSPENIKAGLAHPRKIGKG